jgi:acyl-CoA synthetase (AMP-forming)/AMP-acid ligase II
LRTIRHIIDEKAENARDKVYLIAPEPRLKLTFGRLKESCVSFGKHLMRLGLKKGDKVSFLLRNGCTATEIFLGAMYSGFVITPLNLLAHPSQLEYVLNHSDTKLVFHTEDQREGLRKAVKQITHNIQLFEIQQDVEVIFPTDETLSDLALPNVEEEDDALLLYTSGSTGVPKGVILSHKNMVSGGQYTTLAHNLTYQDRALCSLPLYHINGEVVTVLGPLISGGSVVMPHRFSTPIFWQLISEYRCTWFSVVPTIISYLMNANDIEEKGKNLTQLRFGRSASSALPIPLQEAFEKKFKVPIIETMGLTETAGPVFSNPMDLTKRKYGSVGLAVGNRAKVVESDGKELPRGIQGEIMIRGDNVMKGYYKAPDITAATIEADGWLHTEDLGYMDEDGFVFVTGRIKELIIKGGENIAPREIDDVLYKHPAVLEAAAVGIPDDSYGEEILCCVVLKPGTKVTAEELRSHCLEHLGAFKTPKVIKVMKELPKGPSAKIQRLRLREYYTASSFKLDDM